MNKRTKIMLVLLSAATMTAGVLGITGCKNKTDKTKAVDVYQTYVAYAEANGQEPMTYEQWLETVKGNVFIKGDPGQPGAPGEAGKPGETGAPGKGVEDVVISDDGKSLEINYTDGTKDTVKLPDQVTHVHQYDDTVITLIPVSAEEDRDGLGYKVCNENGCEHIELVVINKYYNITVKDTDGKPVSGVDVVINGARATTNENGLAKVQGFGNYNDYIISVDSPGYATDQIYRTLNGATQELTINRALTKHNAEYGGYYYTFDNEGAYTIDVPTGDDGGGYCTESPLEVRIINDTASPKKYKLSVVDDANKGNANVTNSNDDSVLVNGVYTVALAAGEQAIIKLAIDGGVLWNMMAYEKAPYSLKFEEVEAPAVGTEELPAQVALDETVNVLTEVADGDGWVYYKWVNNMDQVPGISFNLTNAEASFIKAYYNSNGVQQIGASPIVSGETFDIRVVDPDWGTADSVGSSMSPASFLFKVKATGANPSFKLNIAARTGNIYNPQQVILGTKASLPIVNWEADWFKFTVDTETVYTVILGEFTTLYVYDSFDNAISMEMVDPVETLETYPVAKHLIKLAPGEYYLKMENGEENHEFTLRLPAAEDEGSSIILPKDISSQVDFTSSTTATITAASNNYYTFVAPEDGKLNVSGGARLDNKSGGMSLDNEQTYQAGDKIIILAASDGDITLTWTAATAVEPVALTHTFTIKDNSGLTFAECAPVQGVTVTVKDGDTVVATSEATGANGQVTLSFIPGSYKIELSGYNTETYTYEGASTGTSSTNYDIRLASEKHDYTFTAKTADGTTFSGATVKIMKGATVIASGTTNDNGVVTFQNVFMPLSGELKYTCELAGADADDYEIPAAQIDYMTISSGNKTTTERDIVFAALVEYSVKVVNANGNGVQGITVQLTDGAQNNPKVLKSAVTGLDGVAKIKMVAGTYGIAYADVPSGHNVSANAVSTSESVFVYEAQYLDGDQSAVGDTLDNASWGLGGEIGRGVNVITNNDAVNYYAFTSARGRYSFKIQDEAGKGYISFLAIYGEETTVLLLNGNQQSVAGNIVLGSIRGRDKAYEFTLDLSLSKSDMEYLVIGYATGTDNGGKANLVVEQVSSTGEYDLHEGNNEVAFVNGSATLSYTYNGGNDMALSWDASGVTVSVSVDGEAATPYTSGDVIFENMGQYEYVFTVTSTSAVSAVFNLTVEPHSYS